MLVKSHPRKTPSFSQLIHYLNQPTPKQLGPAILHNLISPPDHPHALTAEFLDNHQLLKKRKNGNALYHEILSFSPKDRPHLAPAILEDLTRQYIQLRCPNALVYARPHLDTDHPHIHLAISANNLGNERPHRLSKADFRHLKQQLEQYQQQQYPELTHSLAQTTSTKQPERRAESELNRRLNRSGNSSRKAQVCQLIRQALGSSSSLSSFVTQTRLLGFSLYRNGATVGVIDQATNRRYRLSTLGLLDTYQELAQRPEHTAEPEKERRLADLADLRAQTKTVDRSLSRE